MSTTQEVVQEVGATGVIPPDFYGGEHVRLAAGVQREVTLSDDGSAVVRRRAVAVTLQVGKKRYKIKRTALARDFANAILKAAAVCDQERAADG